MSMTSYIAITAVLAFLAGAGGAWLLFRFFGRLDQRISTLERRAGVVTDARGRTRARHSLNTQAGLEDTSSLLIDAALDAEALRARLETALAAVSAIRGNPNGYSEVKK